MKKTEFLKIKKMMSDVVLYFYKSVSHLEDS